jgi:hypothetical protein
MVGVRTHLQHGVHMERPLLQQHHEGVGIPTGGTRVEHVLAPDVLLAPLKLERAHCTGWAQTQHALKWGAEHVPPPPFPHRTVPSTEEVRVAG